MTNVTVKCKQCPKTFSHPTQQKADQALAMHVGRKHKKNIINAHRHSGVLRQHRNGDLSAVPAVATKGRRSYLTSEQSGGIVSFIHANKAKYTNKTECVKAALASVGATGQIKVNSTAVHRYYKKAESPDPNFNGLELAPARRPYTRRVQPKPVKAEVQINFCPCCGFNMHALATGMALAATLK